MKSMSLRVTIPSSLDPILPSSVMGMPLNFWRVFMSLTSLTCIATAAPSQNKLYSEGDYIHKESEGDLSEQY